MKNRKSKMRETNNLYKAVAATLTSKRLEFDRLANMEMLLLFRNIGMILNQRYENEFSSKAISFSIDRLSEQLQLQYGTFLSTYNLLMMIKFSKIFTEGFMKDSLVQLITWEDVLLLLTTKNHDQLAFYLTLRINKGSTKDLETAMSASMHLNSKKEKQNRNETLELSKQISIERLTPEMLSKNAMQETNMFKEPVLSQFRILTEPAKKKLEVNKKHVFENDIFSKIGDAIQRYRNQQNRRLNTHLNLLFWEIGKRINDEFSTDPTSGWETEFAKGLRRSNGDVSNLFSSNQLRAMRQYAADFSNIEEASQLASLLTWEHILILLSANEPMSSRIFYANMTAIEGWNAEELKDRIDVKTYERTVSLNAKEAESLNKFSTPKIQTKVKKHNRFIESITSVNYQSNPNNLANYINIFQNPYFISFVHCPEQYKIS